MIIFSEFKLKEVQRLHLLNKLGEVHHIMNGGPCDASGTEKVSYSIIMTHLCHKL